MEPEIRYARTNDNISIAYYTLGSGPVLVVLPPSISGTMMEQWHVAEDRRTLEFAARAFTVVRLDLRGSGLSGAFDGEYTLDALVADVAAVVDAVSPDDPVLLQAPGRQSMVGIAYAASYPERVRKLALWLAASTGAEVDPEPLRHIRQLARVDWDLAVHSLTQAISSFEDPARAQQEAEKIRATDPALFVRYDEDSVKWDVRDAMPRVSAPTLVLHPKSNRYFPLANAQRVAAAIPRAQLKPIETASVLGGGEEMGRALASFYLDAPMVSREPRSTAAILFADIVDSTALTEQLGDVAFRDRSRALEERLRAAIAAANGWAIEGRTLGDGVLATFRSARDAIDAARHCAQAGEELGLKLHIGLHAGDVLRDGNNVYGGAVNIAARISSLAAPNEILVSGTIRDLARTSAGIRFEDRGEHALKGVSDAQRVFAVRDNAI
jgi:class 3 adenylate cyclase/pimeloyl-ACP methyl ester carboxylesterase